MNTFINACDEVTLQAIILGLTELDTKLPENLQQEIHQISICLVRSDDQAFNQTLNRLLKLLKSHERFEQLYLKARSELHTTYESHFYKYDFRKDIAVKMFQATDYQQMAEQILKENKDTSDAFLTLWKYTLFRAIARTNLQMVSILKAIEEIFFTTEDLMYRFFPDVPKERTIALVQQLWDEGKIDTLGGGILGRIFPQFRKKEKPALKEPLALTSRGFFYLHPIIGLRK